MELSGFFVIVRSYDMIYGGLGDGFVLCFGVDGVFLRWLMFFGGDDFDEVNVVVFNDFVGVVVVGIICLMDYLLMDYVFDWIYNGVLGFGFLDVVFIFFKFDGEIEYLMFFGGY